MGMVGVALAKLAEGVDCRNDKSFVAGWEVVGELVGAGLDEGVGTLPAIEQWYQGGDKRSQ